MGFCSRLCRGGLGRFHRTLVGKMVAEVEMGYCPWGSRVLALKVLGVGPGRHGRRPVLSTLRE